MRARYNILCNVIRGVRRKKGFTFGFHCLPGVTDDRVGAWILLQARNNINRAGSFDISPFSYRGRLYPWSLRAVKIRAGANYRLARKSSSRGPNAARVTEIERIFIPYNCGKEDPWRGRLFRIDFAPEIRLMAVFNSLRIAPANFVDWPAICSLLTFSRPFHCRGTTDRHVCLRLRLSVVFRFRSEFNEIDVT